MKMKEYNKYLKDKIRQFRCVNFAIALTIDKMLADQEDVLIGDGMIEDMLYWYYRKILKPLYGESVMSENPIEEI